MVDKPTCRLCGSEISEEKRAEIDRYSEEIRAHLNHLSESVDEAIRINRELKQNLHALEHSLYNEKP